MTLKDRLQFFRKKLFINIALKLNIIREAANKFFFSGQATNALSPPSSLVATFFLGFFFELQKKIFFLSGPAS